MIAMTKFLTELQTIFGWVNEFHDTANECLAGNFIEAPIAFYTSMVSLSKKRSASGKYYEERSRKYRAKRCD